MNNGWRIQWNFVVLVFAQCSRHMNGDLENFFSGKVGYHPITTKDQARLHQFGKKVLSGTFTGYAGGSWKGYILVAHALELKKMTPLVSSSTCHLCSFRNFILVFRREHLLSAHSSLGLCFVLDPHRHSWDSVTDVVSLSHVLQRHCTERKEWFVSIPHPYTELLAPSVVWWWQKRHTFHRSWAQVQSDGSDKRKRNGQASPIPQGRQSLTKVGWTAHSQHFFHCLQTQFFDMMETTNPAANANGIPFAGGNPLLMHCMDQEGMRTLSWELNLRN